MGHLRLFQRRKGKPCMKVGYTESAIIILCHNQIPHYESKCAGLPHSLITPWGYFPLSEFLISNGCYKEIAKRFYEKVVTEPRGYFSFQDEAVICVDGTKILNEKTPIIANNKPTLAEIIALKPILKREWKAFEEKYKAEHLQELEHSRL